MKRKANKRKIQKTIHKARTNENIKNQLQSNSKQNPTSVSIMSEIKTTNSIYANKNVRNLDTILKFGYSHKYQESKQSKRIKKGKKNFTKYINL